jgi:TonB family protein
MFARALLVLFLLPCAAALAEPPPQPDLLPITSLAINETDPERLQSILRIGLLSPNPRVRGVAARVMNVRRVVALLDHLRVALDREHDPDAAREEARAVVMLGGTRDVDRALFASDKFGRRLDTVIAVSAARLGTKSAIDAYFASLQKREIDGVAFFRTALWGHPQDATALGTRLLEAKDKDGFGQLLFALRDEPRELLNLQVITEALNDDDDDEDELRIETAWYLVNRGVASTSKLDPAFKPLIADLRIKSERLDGIVALELLRRMAGLSRTSTDGFRAALGSSRLAQVRIALAPRRLFNNYLNDQEKLLLFNGAPLPERVAESGPVPFVVPSGLPSGASEAVMRAVSCSADWLGKARLTVDLTGRVTTLDLAQVTTTDGCRRALDILVRLSLVSNEYVTAPFEIADVSLVHARKAAVCFDEGPQSIRLGKVFGRSNFRFPRTKNAPPPNLPEGTKHSATEVVIEAVITPTGCVRAARVIKGAGNPVVDTAALKAVSQWTFEPAHMDADPAEITMQLHVDVGDPVK